ncbi:MAG: hypothetical protein ACXAB7_07345 [Candidatus Kariarchaeaceae archaeon]|jgi:hypothetical protein
MASVLIDRQSLQVMAHFDQTVDENGKTYENPDGKFKRLNRFLEVLRSVADNYTISENSITESALARCKLYIILTRFIPFSPTEIDVIHKFVQKGGNLLLMSNHEPDHQFDVKLAAKFGIKLWGDTYWSGERGKYSTLTEIDLTDHNIITGNGENKVQSIVTNTTCKIEYDRGDVIAYLSDRMVRRRGEGPETPSMKKIFALSIQEKGKIVITADSGFIGDKGSTFPGWGLIEEGDNVLFIRNILSYLLENG